ncbi:MAG: hypothetical protein HC777_02805 [Hyphomonadaceae bacterium]|nr:hypothetical protein [Hyphomonadaceae bacterium]
MRSLLKMSVCALCGLSAVAGLGISAAQAQQANLEHMAFAAGTTQSDRQTISIRAGETLEQALVRAGALRMMRWQHCAL